MQLVTYNSKELLELIKSEQYAQWKSVPITPKRALAQALHPSIAPDNILLIVAIDNNQCVGFMGFLPNNIHLNKNKIQVAWISGAWVDAANTNKGIFIKLLKQGLMAYDNKVLITEFTDDAMQSFNRSGQFDSSYQLVGRRFYFRGFTQIKYPKLIINQALDSIINATQSIKFGIYNLINKHKNEVSICDNIAFDKTSELGKRVENSTIYSEAISSQWITQSKQMVSTKRYFFTEYATQWEVFYIQLKSSYLFVTIRDGHCKLFDVDYHWDDENELLEQLFIIIKKYKIIYLTSFDANVLSSLHKMNGYYFDKKIVRKFMITKTITTLYKENNQKIELKSNAGDALYF
jgi:hypothetical protein